MLLHQSKSKWTSLTLKFAEKKRVERTALAIVILNRFQCVCMPFVNSLVCVYVLSDHFSIIFFLSSLFMWCLSSFTLFLRVWSECLKLMDNGRNQSSFFLWRNVCVCLDFNANEHLEWISIGFSWDAQLLFLLLLLLFIYFKHSKIISTKITPVCLSQNKKTSHIQIFSIHKLSGEKKIPSALKHSRWFTSNE